MVQNGMTNRAEKHRSEPTETAGADNQQIRTSGRFDEGAGCRSDRDLHSHVDVGETLLPGRHRLAQ